MANPRLIITAQERALIQDWITGFDAPDLTTRNSLAKLAEELRTADIREEADLPKDVVRVGSTVSFSSPSVRKENLQLVLPKHADLKANKLSVFTVMGSALIGYREGTAISWTLPKGDETIRLEKVDNTTGLQ
jgi:regulator of nucleoside diphosphate kinase